MNKLPKFRDNIYLGFYLGGRKAKKGILRFLTTAVVRAFTKSKVIIDNKKCKISHVELVFPDGLSYSSDGFDGGVRFKNIDYLKHPERWAFLEYHIDKIYKSRYIDETLKKKCALYVGAKYDYIGVITHFGLRFVKKENPDKWWCSEICSKILNLKNNKISPATMYRLCIELSKKRAERLSR